MKSTSPNPRLQRTRMRAPLSRKPLGALSIFLLAIAAVGQPLPSASFVNRFFVRFDSRWERPPRKVNLPIRTADVTIVLFKKSGEFVEHSCNLIEGPDKTRQISGGDGHVVAVGTWLLEGRRIRIHRDSIDRMVWPVGGGPDPLCGSTAVSFEVAGDRLVQGKGIFRPTLKIDEENFEAYAANARASHARCGA